MDRYEIGDAPIEIDIKNDKIRIQYLAKAKVDRSRYTMKMDKKGTAKFIEILTKYSQKI